MCFRPSDKFPAASVRTLADIRGFVPLDHFDGTRRTRYDLFFPGLSCTMVLVVASIEIRWFCRIVKLWLRCQFALHREFSRDGALLLNHIWLLLRTMVSWWATLWLTHRSGLPVYCWSTRARRLWYVPLSRVSGIWCRCRWCPCLARKWPLRGWVAPGRHCGRLSSFLGRGRSDDTEYIVSVCSCISDTLGADDGTYYDSTT